VNNLPDAPSPVGENLPANHADNAKRVTYPFRSGEPAQQPPPNIPFHAPHVASPAGTAGRCFLARVIDSAASGMLEHAMTNLHFNDRADDRVLKVARTLADLAGLENITANNVLEAIQYRTLDRTILT